MLIFVESCFRPLAGISYNGNKLDVAVDTHENALAWAGYGTHRVWIIEDGEP